MASLVIDTIGPHLDVLMLGLAKHTKDALEQGAEEVEAYAKDNAPWSDITGEARNGLTADVGEESGDITITLYHTAEHGRWLELIQDGAFAIIMPTLEALGPEILRRASLGVMGEG
jgi:hypothetical protein